LDEDVSKKEQDKTEQDPQKKKVEHDPEQELRETEQEVMFELKIKTDEFLEKFKEHNRKNRVTM